MLPARLAGVEFGVIGQLWPPHQRTDMRPGILARAALQARMYPAVLRPDEGTRPSGGLTSELVLNGGVNLGDGDGLHRRDVNMLPMPFDIPHIEGQHGRSKGTHTGRIVGSIPADLERLLVGQADRMHQGPHRLGDEF